MLRRRWGHAQTNRRRKTRREHPGVSLVPPRQGRGWLACYRDTDTGRKQYPDLRVLAGVTDERRARAWARAKSHEIATRKDALESGAARTRGEPIRLALDRFLAVKADKTKPSPTEDADHYARRLAKWERAKASRPAGYRRFLDWAAQRGLVDTASITERDLAEFHDDLAGMCRTEPVEGGSQGERKVSSHALAVRSRNGLVTRVRSFLRWCARRSLLSTHLTTDRIVGALELESVHAERPKILDRAKVRRLVQAAIRHDEDHGAVASPLVLMALLTGCRKEEIAGLDWGEVDLSGTGTINLPGYRVKTREGRTIDLGVTPSVRRLLAALHLRAGRPSSGSIFPSSPSLRVVKERLVGTWYEEEEEFVGGFGADAFTWKTLRATSGSFLANAHGCAYTFRAVAERLGHDTDVCDRYYQRRPAGIPKNARTLEHALGVHDLVGGAIQMVGGSGHAERRSHPDHRKIASR